MDRQGTERWRVAPAMLLVVGVALCVPAALLVAQPLGVEATDSSVPGMARGGAE